MPPVLALLLVAGFCGSVIVLHRSATRRVGRRRGEGSREHAAARALARVGTVGGVLATLGLGTHRTMRAPLLLGGSLLLLAGCESSGLGSLVVEGPELHPSLVTRRLEDAAKRQLAPVLRDNPYLSTDSAFVDVIARYTSQGRLAGGQGVRAALYALYLGEGGGQVGLYGLEAVSPADADRIEGVVREITTNERLGLSRVHRKGNVLVVAWQRGVSPSTWEAVNAGVVERLTAR
jgi:hypothetical protein